MKAFSLAPNANAHLIDVREAGELASTGSIPNALNVPLPALPAFFRERVEEWRDDLLVFSCARGMRAERAAWQAKEAGFKQVAVYYGSYADWQQRHNK